MYLLRVQDGFCNPIHALDTLELVSWRIFSQNVIDMTNGCVFSNVWRLVFLERYRVPYNFVFNRITESTIQLEVGTESESNADFQSSMSSG